MTASCFSLRLCFSKFLKWSSWDIFLDLKISLFCPHLMKFLTGHKNQGLPRWLGKEFVYQCRKHGLDPCVGKIPWRRKWQPTVVFLPGKIHGQRRPVGCSSWSRKDLVTTEHKNQDWNYFYYSHCFSPQPFSIASLLSFNAHLLIMSYHDLFSI